MKNQQLAMIAMTLNEKNYLILIVFLCNLMPFLARWIMITPIIRPDIPYYVRVVSQFMN